MRESGVKTPSKSPAWILGAGSLATLDLRAGLLVVAAGVLHASISAARELLRERARGDAVVRYLVHARPGTVVDVGQGAEPQTQVKVDNIRSQGGAAEVPALPSFREGSGA
jgi:hypothetical protein